MKKKLVIMTLASCMLATAFTSPVYAIPKDYYGDIFDAEFYAEMYPDVAEANCNDAESMYWSYKNWGQEQGKLPYSPDLTEEELAQARERNFKKEKAEREKKEKQESEERYKEKRKEEREKKKKKEEKARKARIAKMLKNGKKIKTKQKLYSHYKKRNAYGIYDDATIRTEFKDINKYRKSKGLPKYKLNKKLCKAAAILAIEQLAGDYTDIEKGKIKKTASYYRPDGSHWRTAVDECGIKNYKELQALMPWFLGNPEKDLSDHIMYEPTAIEKEIKSVLDGKKFSEIGIGYYDDGYDRVYVIIAMKK